MSRRWSPEEFSSKPRLEFTGESVFELRKPRPGRLGYFNGRAVEARIEQRPQTRARYIFASEF